MFLNERINLLIETLGLTRHYLANASGIAPTNLSKMLNGDQTITDKTLRKITSAFPQVSYAWLKTGEGDMLLSDPPVFPAHQSSDPTVAELIATIGKQADIIKAQQETIKNLTETLHGLTIGN